MGAQLIVEFFAASRFVLIAEGGRDRMVSLVGIGPERAARELDRWLASGATWSFNGLDLLTLDAGDVRLSLRGMN